MATIYDVDPGKLIKSLSEELKKVEQIKAPEWGKFVKTGCGKERPPRERDWWHIRTASVLRKIYIFFCRTMRQESLLTQKEI